MILCCKIEELQRNRRAMLKYDDDDEDDDEDEDVGFVDSLQAKTNADGSK
jgi:hypothetical protein